MRPENPPSQWRLSALWRNAFARSAGVLIGGTSAAQALALLALPVLTRLYSPEEFSLLAAYVAMLTITQVVACLRLEIAIPLPGDDSEAINLLSLALVLATGAAALTALVVLFPGPSIFSAIGQPDMQPYGWLLPLGVWMAGSYSALQFWATRKKRFDTIARTRMIQAGSGLTVQLALGWAGVGPLGLMVGHALMAGAGVVTLVRQTILDDRVTLLSVSWKAMWDELSHYRRIPQYSTLEALANNAAIQVPVLLITALAVGPEAGFVLLATRAMGVPATLIGGAVGQVYLSRAPEEMRHGRLPEFTFQTLKGLATIGVAPLILIALIAPEAFSFVFGETWRRAGELVTWMTPWFVLKLLSSPISMVMHVRMMQRTMLAVMLFGLILRVGSVIGANRFLNGFEAEAYAVSSAVFYVVAFWVFSRAAGLFGGKLR